MKELATVLYGSQNYGLAIDSSDRDFKVLLCPGFEDLYHRRKVSAEDLPAQYDHEHYSPIGVTRFHELIMHGNPNCLEMLFSTEWKIFSRDLAEYLDEARLLFAAGYLAYIWDDFYSAMKGIILNAVKRNGATPKTVSRGWFFYNMMYHIAEHGFVVNASTFRGGFNFQSVARSIRTNEVIARDIEESPDTFVDCMYRWFSDPDNNLTKMAEDHRRSLSEQEVKEISTKCNQLNNLMQRIVAREIYMDIKDEVVFQ